MTTNHEAAARAFHKHVYDAGICEIHSYIDEGEAFISELTRAFERVELEAVRGKATQTDRDLAHKIGCDVQLVLKRIPLATLDASCDAIIALDNRCAEIIAQHVAASVAPYKNALMDVMVVIDTHPQFQEFAEGARPEFEKARAILTPTGKGKK